MCLFSFSFAFSGAAFHLRQPQVFWYRPSLHLFWPSLQFFLLQVFAPLPSCTCFHRRRCSRIFLEAGGWTGRLQHITKIAGGVSRTILCTNADWPRIRSAFHGLLFWIARFLAEICRESFYLHGFMFRRSYAYFSAFCLVVHLLALHPSWGNLLCPAL